MLRNDDMQFYDNPGIKLVIYEFEINSVPN